ncbi:MAG: GTP pyrophosphokinase family protein [Defluviitaleaceae bacterium]|nr:GTP pyrophosphokinase family protein [Defluviitaleaceae bacterium]
MSVRFSEAEFAKLKDLMIVYEWGQKMLLTKLDIIHEDLKNSENINPIESIKGRIKSPESIAAKLERLGEEITAESAKRRLRDIAGVRIICPFASDVFYLAQIIKSIPSLTVLLEKDYVSQPKPSGYRSYHIIVDVPVFYANKMEEVTVEVQIRTEGMNFWSNLEHKARYKYKEQIPADLCEELVTCAGKISELDNRMCKLHDAISMMSREA